MRKINKEYRTVC